MENTNTTKRKKGGGFLLIMVGIFFTFQFTKLDSTNSIMGMVTSVFILILGLYSIFKTSKENI
ncbi:hypothetical protein [uncultured Winogradskyella sp.]|uniref:hypothetical protein n=1 Tax=uncultured Winogradskyella sp. TaxID=395353 RepID=UPI0030DBE6EA